MVDESTRLPRDDTNLANLLAIWGYELDSKNRVMLTKLTSESDSVRVQKYTMHALRGLLTSRATVRDLRTVLTGYFRIPRPGPR
jgi:hypothetical protein